MNKKNIWVFATSSVITAAAIGGGIASVVIAQDRSNAYAPSTLQKRRMALLDSFINDDHFTDINKENLEGINVGNPFTMVAKANLSKVIEDIIGKDKTNKNMFKNVDLDAVNLINKMAFLRLDEDQDALVIILNDKDGKPINSAYIKIDLDIDYDTESSFASRGAEFLPETIVKNTSPTDKIYALDFDNIKQLADKDHLLSTDKSNSDKFRNSLDGVSNSKSQSYDRATFTRSLIDSLILWKIYNCNPTEISNMNTKGDLLKYINKNADTEAAKNAITKKFVPYKETFEYFPSSIDIGETEIISSDMDLIEKLGIPGSGTKEFYNFEKATMMGLLLFQDAYIDKDKLVVDTNRHRSYNPLSSLKDASEPGYEVKSSFEDAISHYKYFIKGDK